MNHITDEQIAAAVRQLYADDTAASMGLADDIRTVRAVLALQPSASAEPVQEDGSPPFMDAIAILRGRGMWAAVDALNDAASPTPVTAAREQEASATGAEPAEFEPAFANNGTLNASELHAIWETARPRPGGDADGRLRWHIAMFAEGLQKRLATPTTSTTGKVDAS